MREEKTTIKVDKDLYNRFCGAVTQIKNKNLSAISSIEGYMKSVIDLSLILQQTEKRK